MEHKDIYGFDDENSFLSNMYKCNIIYFDRLNNQKRVFESSEHIYQAEKATNKDEYINIATAPTPYKAKRLGGKVALGINWHNIKYDIMLDIVTNKFKQNEDLAKKLLATGNCYIEETNNWNDTYWGVCKGIGYNHLGKILMIVRDVLKNG